MLRNKRFVLKLAALIIIITLVIVAITAILKEPSVPVEGHSTLPDQTVKEELPAGVRSVVVSDAEVLPLLPIKGAKLHFIPGNMVELGHESIPLQVTIRCGASQGLLWFSGIPSWLDLSRVDKNIDSYCSRWTPAWSFIVDSSAATQRNVVTEDGILTNDTTPLFDWATIADEPGARYYLQVGASNDFRSPLWVRENIYDTYYQVTGAEEFANGKYYWRLMQRGRVWITGMPPWLNLSRYDPEVTKMPAVVGVESGDGTAKINYIIK